MTAFIAHVAAVDYLSVSTFNPVPFNKLLAAVTSCDIQPDDVQRMQYMGQQQSFHDGSVFWGTGEQKGTTHYLIQASGARADSVTAALISLDLPDTNITRLDIQLTIPLPDWFKARAFVDTLRGNVWIGRSRKVTMIDNYGDDTVYVGSRKSDRFARFYVKETSFLRCEFEYKGVLADRAYRLMALEGQKKAAAGILHRELHKLPAHPVCAQFRAVLARFEELEVKRVKPQSKRYRWFVKQCVPAIVTLLNDHDSGGMTRGILLDLINGEWNNE